MLAFGSNRCPSKITWLRRELGLDGPVVVLRVAVSGVAAVWAAGWRARDGARPATLAVVPDAGNGTMLPSDARTAPFTHPAGDPDAEVHGVWLATPDQVAVLDVCEGRGRRYALAWVHAARVVSLDDGARLDPVLAYWPAEEIRAPLLVDGAPVRCRDVPQDRARTLEGVPGGIDADAATIVPAGTPDPRGWPARVFVYGTLQPGAPAWWRLAPAARRTWPARAAGRVHDTGRGYPALVRDPHGGHRPRPRPRRRARRPGRDAPGARRLRGAGLPPRAHRRVPRGERGRPRGGGLLDGGSRASPGPTVCWAWVWNGPVGDWPAVVGSWRA